MLPPTGAVIIGLPQGPCHPLPSETTVSLTLNHQRIDDPPTPAATIVMLREAGPTFEVLLIKRHAASGVLGGAHVFPGGKVDALDHQIDRAGRLDRPLAELRAGLADETLTAEAALAIHVAAIREAWEESGVLLADAAAPADAEPVAAAAAAEGLIESQLARGFDARMAAPGARLRTRDLVPWTRWITPRRPSVTQRRFDTWFFLTAVAAEVEVRLDQHEAVESLWIAPAAALAAYWRNELVLAAPQIMSLVHLARHPSIGTVIDEARRRGVQRIEPEVADIDGVRTTCYPGDALHPVSEQRLPGPTRLSFRQGRFEPAGGLASLLPGER